MGDKRCLRRVVGGVAVAALTTLGWGCYPGEINDIGEADLVITARDTTFTFAPGTFFLPDTIIRLSDDADDEDDIDRSFDAAILAQVAGEFEAMGYTRVDEGAATPPDFVVLIGASSSTFNVWYPGGGWWGWWGWGGWWGGWWGGCCYYPGYPWYPPVYAGSYQTGSLFVTMIDPNAIAGEVIPGHWGGIINGLLSSSNATTAARVTDLIDQMFDQSPYLAGN